MPETRASSSSNADERLDSKGRRVGRRAFNGPGNIGRETYPKRREAGLCPGLEAAVWEVIEAIEIIQATEHDRRQHDGMPVTCQLDPCHYPFDYLWGKLSDGLDRA